MEDRQEVSPDREGGEAEKTESAPFAGLLEDSFAYDGLKRGDVVEGVIVSKRPGEILVNIGTKSEAFVSTRELERMSAEELGKIHVGESLPVFVLRPEDAEGNAILSLRRAQMEADWQEAENLCKANEILERKVVGYNKGGLIVRVGKIRGFVPTSQLGSTSRALMRSANPNEESALVSLVDKTLKLKIIEVDRARNRLILSEREADKELRRRRKEELLDELREGEQRHGVVSSLCRFGAFVDLGGADGLVHLSELSWGRVNDPAEVVKVGDEVDVQVLKVDRERNRIALSLKRLKPEPWSEVVERYYVGQLVQATITKLANFGAFARLDKNIEGLIHISELSEERINHPRDVVKEGDVVTLRVIRIDTARRRMGLSLRRAQDDSDWEEES